jgi:hypothetical protein
MIEPRPSFRRSRQSRIWKSIMPSQHRTGVCFSTEASFILDGVYSSLCGSKLSKNGSVSQV